MSRSQASRDEERKRQARKAAAKAKAKAQAEDDACRAFAEQTAKEHSEMLGEPIDIGTHTGVKMSAVLLDFAEPYIEYGDEVVMAKIYTFAATVWNVALEHKTLPPEFIALLDKEPVPTEMRKMLRAMATDMIQRKHQHFPQYRNWIANVSYADDDLKVAHCDMSHLKPR